TIKIVGVEGVEKGGDGIRERKGGHRNLHPRSGGMEAVLRTYTLHTAARSQRITKGMGGKRQFAVLPGQQRRALPVMKCIKQAVHPSPLRLEGCRRRAGLL